MSEIKEQNKGEVVIYKAETGPEIKIKMQDESIWLTQAQIADLFQTERSVVTKHLRNIFKTSELSESSVCAIFAHTAADGKTYKVRYYGLDAVIAVGYRVNSKRATQFRMWATQRLHDYILKGFAVNEARLKEKSQAKLKELEGAIKLLQGAIKHSSVGGLEKELLVVMVEYANTWVLLSNFDDGEIPIGEGTRSGAMPQYSSLKTSVQKFTERLQKSNMAEKNFGLERGSAFSGLVAQLVETRDDISKTGATLFYRIIKEQPFVAGNKQIASLLLLVYLINNNYYYNKKGEKKLDDKTMTLLSLLVEESRQEDKDIVTQLIASMINKK